MKKTFFMKLIPPRSTFAHDMTDAEKAIMQEHIFYWKVLIQKGICITFGPVLDPAGVYGVAIVRIDDESQLAAIEANDPSVKHGVNKFESFPMIATFE
ncbi:YciI family protein [Pseudochryseolinea flava]|uniref:YCII-related domain-containing protein n=1 Tax=Pseudochryseolinea flava TaxID=2059302 RepID=A0A364Y7P3_9BACT|nr:YciI family protein [Pseudochryseolinea flava]RAW02970.1 hypothetical protein DQQ10_02375 [Pseudochryseolinea flava]